VKEKQSFKTHLRPINSNPANNSYIVVGVEDQDNEIVGDFFDDSHIQNLVNAYLENPPKFNMKMSLSKLTKRQSNWISDCKTKNNTSYFKKGIHTIPINSVLDMAVTRCRQKRKLKRIFKTRNRNRD
jgi:hypothetical protein